MYVFGAVLTWAICLTFLAAALGLILWALWGVLRWTRQASRWAAWWTYVGMREALPVYRRMLGQ